MNVDPKLAADLAIERARLGDVEWFLTLAWGPLLTEDELLAGHDGQFIDEFGLDLIRSGMSPKIRKVWCKGNTGCGKNHAAAKWAVAYYTAWPDSKIIVTRDTYDQAKLKMWGEIDLWLGKSRIKPRGNIRNDGISDGTQHFIIVANPATDEGFSGAHTQGGHVALLGDEATALRPGIFKMADTQTQKQIFIFNPRVASGPCRQAFPKGERADITQTVRGRFGYERLITIGGTDLANVRHKRLEMPIVPDGGMVIDGKQYEAGAELDDATFDRVKRLVPGQTCYDKWVGIMSNPDGNYVRTFGLGKFPEEDTERQVVAGSWLDRATQRHERWHRLYRRASGKHRPGEASWKRPQRRHAAMLRLLAKLCPVTAVGVDPAGSDQGDETSAAFGGRLGVRKQVQERIVEVEELFAWLLQQAKETGADPKALTWGIDPTGVGHGLCSLFRTRGYRVLECWGSKSVLDADRFKNDRVARVMLLGERINPEAERGRLPFGLPADDLLAEELLAYEKFRVAGDGKWDVTPKRGKTIKVEANDEVRQIEPIALQLGRSPDRADAVGYMLDAAMRGLNSSMASWLG